MWINFSGNSSPRTGKSNLDAAESIGQQPLARVQPLAGVARIVAEIGGSFQSLPSSPGSRIFLQSPDCLLGMMAGSGSRPKARPFLPARWQRAAVRRTGSGRSEDSVHENRRTEGTRPGERRVALIPDHVEQLVHKGIQVTVEASAGAGAGCPDEAYRSAGAEVSSRREDMLAAADLVAGVRCLPAEDVARLGEGCLSISFPGSLPFFRVD